MADCNTVTMLISCPDQKGIVSKVSTFVFENQGNIIDSQQHSTGLDDHFFMRVCIDASSIKLSLDELEEKFNHEIGKAYQMDVSFHAEKQRMAILVSKYDHCLYDILLRHQYGELKVEIPMIISNHPDLEHVAKNFNIPFYHLGIDPSKPREEAKANQEKAIIDLLKKENIDFVALARYMQILTPNFINEYLYKIINVHHGFLPAFKGAKPYHQAYDKGVKIIGATAHYATEDLDMGPIIEQGVIHVDHRDIVEDYIAKGRDIEQSVFAKALKAHAENKIIVHNSKTIVFD